MSIVYVSSTFLDLQEHRRALGQALRRLGHVDVAMEYYTAEHGPAHQRCLADVAASDLYVGVFAWRYGWVPPEDNPNALSITEMEYREAIKHNRPCLIFLLDGQAAWPPNFIDDDRTRIRKLRDELAGRHLAALFTTPQDLVAAATQAVAKWEKGDITTVEFSHYFEILRRRFRRIDLDALTPPQREEYLQLELQSVFVEQNVRSGGLLSDAASSNSSIGDADLDGRSMQAQDDIGDDEPRPVLEFIADPRSRLSVLLGNPGAGKSTLARYLLLSLSDPAANASEMLRQNFDGFVPFLIELRAYVALAASRKCETFLEYLEYIRKTEGWGMRERGIDAYLNSSGKAFFLFDGVDEVFDPEERERIMRQIVAFAETYPAVRMVVTSRILGYRRRILTDAGFQHATLQDLDESQVEVFIDRWYKLALGHVPEDARDRRERLMRTYRESASMRQLAGNPLLLTIMAIIGKHQELPRERWKLYDHAASVLIQHWDVNKHLIQARVEADLIHEEDRKQLLRILAFRMQGAGGGTAGNYVDRDTLHTVFATYVQDRYQADPVHAGSIARAIIEQFRNRNFILSLYGAGLYGFVHRAFLEYFCASAYVFRFEKTHEIEIDDLKDVFRRHWSDPSWHEVLRLICGMIGEKFAGQIIDELLQVDPAPEEASEPWSVALAISCLSEVRNIAAIPNPARKTLCQVLRVFDSPEVDRRFLRDELVKPAISIGPDWPANPAIAQWVLARRHFATTFTDDQLFGELIAATAKTSEECRRALISCLELRPLGYRREAVYALAAGWPADHRTMPLLEKLITYPDGEIRTAAILGLAQYFGSDPKTLLALENVLNSDRYWVARTAALYEVAAQSPDTQHTLELLRQRALNDVSERVQSAARDALAEYFPREAVTLSLLIDQHTRATLQDLLGGPVPDLPQLIHLASAHPDEALRETALRVIAAHFSKLPETFPVLRDRAIHDPRAVVRMCALRALADCFPEAAQTLARLRTSLISDPHPWARETALQFLVERFHRDPRTLDLVRERAIEDPHEVVRESATGAIGRYFLHDWRTVPFLVERLQTDVDANVRRRAAYALGECPDPRALGALSTAWHFDSAERVREACRFVWYGRVYESAKERPYTRIAWAMERLSNEPLDYYWKDGQDFQTLLESDARSHPRASVRSAALTVLETEHGPQPQLLEQRAAADSDPSVRIAALQLIAREYETREELGPDGVLRPRRYLLGRSWSVLWDRGLNDTDGDVRAQAITLLSACDCSERRPDLDFFKQFVTKDPAPSARRAGVYGLIPHLADDTVLKLLCVCAAGDPDPRVRLAALDCLAHSESAEAGSCLEACSTGEADIIVRNFASEAAVAHTLKRLTLGAYGRAALLEYVLNGEYAHLRLEAADFYRSMEDRYESYEQSCIHLWPALRQACLHDPCASNRIAFLGRMVDWFRRRETIDLLRESASTDPDEAVRQTAELLIDSSAG
jgi:HEAT repeat protein